MGIGYDIVVESESEMAGEREEQQQNEGAMQRVQLPSFSQIVGLITLLTVGGVLLTMTGLTLTGTVIGLVMVTPVLILFSPILVPVGTVLFLTVAGFVAAGGLGVGAMTLVSWIYHYLTGAHPPGSDHLDYARRRISDTSAQIGHKARDYAGAVQSKAHDVSSNH
ncbi:hypothetical protein SUGI_0618730 [Cryptomeria japonica]|uniref:oleosin G n=1 Tax=Cryptomeria japonica TaxID=3369 RepID=UPI0024148EE3|nr:oleosin G [Cryptomeria japonica]GLJ30985.1 hypothetical protein SUGI_0618730 [Cryptomeria japonica]